MVTNHLADGLVAENARLRARLDHAEGELSARDAHHTRWQAEKARADQSEAERDALKAELAEAKRDHDMTAEYVGKQLGFHQPIPCATSVGCAMALGEELAEARAAIERVRELLEAMTYEPLGPPGSNDLFTVGRYEMADRVRALLPAALDASERREDTTAGTT